MAHFAQIDENNIVTQVIVVGNEDCLDSDGNESEAVGIAFCKELLGADTNWVQTSYNNNLRCRYAGIGMKYDSANDVFYRLPDYPSWVLNTSTWEWEPPVDKPADAGIRNETTTPHHTIDYTWDEDTTSWTNRTVIDL
tara:strand:+ start:913 stop:1326 length:414 start_codon:yes stop_codon:yes gene_type:complete